MVSSEEEKVKLQEGDMINKPSEQQLFEKYSKYSEQASSYQVHVWSTTET